MILSIVLSWQTFERSLLKLFSDPVTPPRHWRHTASIAVPQLPQSRLIYPAVSWPS